MDPTITSPTWRQLLLGPLRPGALAKIWIKDFELGGWLGGEQVGLGVEVGTRMGGRSGAC